MKEMMGVKFYSVQDISEMIKKPPETIEEYIIQKGIKGAIEGEPFLIAEGNISEFMKGIEQWHKPSPGSK